jgi:hypothetical protein
VRGRIPGKGDVFTGQTPNRTSTLTYIIEVQVSEFEVAWQIRLNIAATESSPKGLASAWELGAVVYLETDLT